MATEYKLSYTANEIDERLTNAGNAVLYTEQSLTDEQKAQARENIGAEDWLDTTVETVIEEVDLNPEWVYGYVNADGTIDARTSHKRTDYLHIGELENVEIRITSVTTTNSEVNLYAARYDKDKNFITGSRATFLMYPLNTDGTVNTDYYKQYANLQKINTDANIVNGLGLDISADDYNDGTEYIIFFNLRDGDEAAMSIAGLTKPKDVIRHIVPDEMLSKYSGPSWFDKKEETIIGKTELDSALVYGYVNTDGSLDTRGTYKRTNYLPIGEFEKVEIRITSFTNDGTSRSLWAARFDGEKNLIDGSRGAFSLKPLNADGTVNTNFQLSSSGLEKINSDTNYVNGMGIDIDPSEYVDGTEYIVFFNFRQGDEVTITVTGFEEPKEVVYYTIPEKMLPPNSEASEAKSLAQEATVLAQEAKMLAQAAASGQEITLSSYVEPLIDEVALAAKAHMKEDSLCFVLFTDTHYVGSDTCFPTLIAKKLAQATNASAILHLGDLAHLYTEDKSVGLQIFQRHSKILQDTKIPYLQVVGNHDDGQMYLHNFTKDYSADNYIKAHEMYQATMKQSRRDIVLGSTKGWYYMDDEDSKTRLVILNAHDYPWVVNEDGTLAYDSNAASSIECIYSTEQLEWLANIALNFADKGDVAEQAKWNVIAFAHMGSGKGWAPINGLFTAFWAGTKMERFSQTDPFGLYDYSDIIINNDFSLVGGRKIAFLMGDIHKDTARGGNYPLITFLDCKLAVANLGTPNEAALSVLVATPSDGTITELRFGEGTKTVDGVEVSHDPLTDYDNYRVFNY